MKRICLFLLLSILLYSCGKKVGAADEAMKLVEERFSKTMLKDSLGESSMSYLWTEYDSEHNSILCFQYGGMAIEYFYHTNKFGGRRDTFIPRYEEPFVDSLRDLYKKLKGGYKNLGLNDMQKKFMGGFSEYITDMYPKEDDWIEAMITEMVGEQF